MAIVKVPVADLRKERDISHRVGDFDPLQETQLLYNEVVEVVERREGWVYVRAVEQLKQGAQGGWVGYPGWVEEAALYPLRARSVFDWVVTSLWTEVRSDDQTFSVPLGTRFETIGRIGKHWQVKLAGGGVGSVAAADGRSLPVLFDREGCLAFGRQFLGQPYLWGGRSSHRSGEGYLWTGVDCSSLVQLLYRLFGIQLPRDSHDQYLFCEPVPLHDLRVGDLLFLKDTKIPDRIGHVMFYAGEGKLLEAVRTFNKVRIVTLQEKMGKSLDQLSSTDLFCGRVIV